MLNWLGEKFDPHAVDEAALAADVEALAKKWTRIAPVKSKRG